MSTASKILVVVVLVLSVIFCGVELGLFAQRANWRALYDAMKAKASTEKADLEKKISDLTAKLSEINQERDRYKAENDNLKGQIENLTQDLQEARARAQQQETLAKEKDDQLAQLNEKVDSMVREIEALNEKMRRDAQTLLETKREYERVVNQLTALRDKNNDLLMKLKNTQRELAEAKSEVEKLTFSLRKYAEKFGETIVETKPKKIIRAHVLAVYNDAGVLMLSVGKDDNVERGMEFIIHRGSDYICKVRVVSTYPDNCVAKIITETLASPDATVNVGDNAFSN